MSSSPGRLKTTLDLQRKHSIRDMRGERDAQIVLMLKMLPSHLVPLVSVVRREVSVMSS